MCGEEVCKEEREEETWQQFKEGKGVAWPGKRQQGAGQSRQLLARCRWQGSIGSTVFLLEGPVPEMGRYGLGDGERGEFKMAAKETPSWG